MKFARTFLSAALACALLFSFALAGETLAILRYDGSALVVDEDGREIIPAGLYGGIYVLSQSPARYAVSAPEGGSLAMAGAGGELLTGYDYDYLYELDGAVCCVKGSRMGMLSLEDGGEIVPCEYTYLTPNGEGGYLALRTDPYDETADGVYRIDESGEVSATGVKALRLYSTMREGLLPAMSPENQLYGYLNSDGVWAIQPQFDYAGDFSGGLAQASISTGAGLISPSGNWLLTPQYEYVDTPDDAGRYRFADTGGSVALIDSDTWQTVRTYENATAYSSQGYIVVNAQDGAVLIGPDGEERFRAEPDCQISAWDIQGDCAVLSQGEWGEEIYWLCDMAGSRLSPSYQWLSSMGNGLYVAAQFEVETRSYDEGALVLNEEVPGTMRTGCLACDGQLIVPLEYEILYAVSSSRLWMEKDGTGFLTDLSGQLVAQFDLGEP